MIVISEAVLLVAIWSLIEGFYYNMPDQSEAGLALVATVAASVSLGTIFFFYGKNCDDYLGKKEALLLVAMSWVFGALICAMPYYIWANVYNIVTDVTTNTPHPYSRIIPAYFESMSGLTTTGATVLSKITSLPRGILMWRSTTHWLGGLGIVVLFVAVLPSLGVGGKKLFQIEAPGPSQPGVRPRIRETARILWMIYMGMTIVMAGLLWYFGMTPFDAINHTFATLATGGFSTQNASAGYYTSPSILIILICFMVMAGMNFGLFYHLIKRKFFVFWSDPELRLYLGILLAGTIFVSLNIYNQPLTLTSGETLEDPTPFTSTLHAAFQVISIQTTTGFCTVDYENWDFLSKMWLVIIMFVGGSAGSTGGGIKVIRILILVKVLLAEIERVFRPNVVRTIKVGKAVIDSSMKLSTLVYTLNILILFTVGAVLIMIAERNGGINGNGIDFVTAATASAATLNNIGPGLHQVGATANYGWFTDFSLAVMSLLMALGRLEIYALLVLFSPHFWKSE